VSTRSEKRPAIRELVRETVSNAILDAAEAVAAEKGLEGTSIAAIAERAGVAVGTLYNYFPDRDALLVALVKTRREAMHARLEAVTVAGDTVEEKLRGYLEGVLGAMEEFRRFVRLAVNDDGTFTRLRGKKPPVLDLIADAIATILKPSSGANASEHARMAVGAMKALMLLRLEEDTPLVPIGSLVASTFVHGVSKR
jgi:AcrR family transcriptional regulator